MTTATFPAGVFDALQTNQARHQLIGYLKELKDDCGALTPAQAVVILGQWYHPLHYFPVFLSRLISVSPTVEAQTHVSRILWEELGEGDPRRAHEKVYVETMRGGGFVEEQLTQAPPLPATRRLLDGYERASGGYLSGLGFLYGTEVVDLPMVSTIGALMKRCTGLRSLEWVNIHVAQEPGHVESSNRALDASFDEDERRRVVASAEEMWTLWTDFFKSIRQEMLS